MLIAALLAVTGNVLIVYALSEADLSVLGPINAYKSVVGLILGIFLVGERPTLMGLTGVLLIVAGSYFVIDRRVNQPLSNAFVRFFSERGIQLRFAALFFSATEAVFLKRAIVLSSPVTVFIFWAVFGFAVAMAGGVVLLRHEMPRQIAILRGAAGTYLAGVRNRDDATGDATHVTGASGWVLPRALSVVDRCFGLPRPPILCGNAHWRTTDWIDRYGSRGSANRPVRPSKLILPATPIHWRHTECSDCDNLEHGYVPFWDNR